MLDTTTGDGEKGRLTETNNDAGDKKLSNYEIKCHLIISTS